MVQAAMIIHTRTRLCDFPSTLAVCPSMLNGREVEQIRKQILAATRSIDSMGQNEVRQMVYTCGSYVIAGMVSFLRNLADGISADEKFYTDEKGRSIYAFVGFVFQAGNQSIPVIDKKVLWGSFKNYMEPVWECTVLETVASNFADISFQETMPTEPTGAEFVSGMTLYATGPDSKPIYLYWLGQALKGKAVSFCSNITDFRVLKDKPFRIIATTANIIERIKRETASTRSTNPIDTTNCSVSNSGAYTLSADAEKKTLHHAKKPLIGLISNEKSNKIWIIILVVLFVVIVLSFISK